MLRGRYRRAIVNTDHDASLVNVHCIVGNECVWRDDAVVEYGLHLLLLIGRELAEVATVIDIEIGL